jgi:hypothetical protein
MRVRRRQRSFSAILAQQSLVGQRYSVVARTVASPVRRTVGGRRANEEARARYVENKVRHRQSCRVRLIGDGVRIIGDYVECGLGGRQKQQRGATAWRAEQRGRKRSLTRYLHYSRITTTLLPSPHNLLTSHLVSVVFLVRFIHRPVHRLQLPSPPGPAAATPRLPRP